MLQGQETFKCQQLCFLHLECIPVTNFRIDPSANTASDPLYACSFHRCSAYTYVPCPLRSIHSPTVSAPTSLSKILRNRLRQSHDDYLRISCPWACPRIEPEKLAWLKAIRSICG